MDAALDAEALRGAYRRLLDRFGPQHWWPAETPFEVMVGAILVQNTAWANVERAIARLRAAELLQPQALLDCDPDLLAETIRSAGYYRVKASRLQGYCRSLLAAGGHEALGRWPTARLRQWLLAITGIGPETADAILLYAFGRRVFVIDAYARRVFGRLGWIEGSEGYEALRGGVETTLDAEAQVYNEYHALLVALGKAHCRPRPRCESCPLRSDCANPPLAPT